MTNHKKLGESLVFRFALLTPLILGAALFLASAFYNDNYEVCLSSKCINYFFELYKYPLSLLGLSVPLTAIAAALHRSEEASQQIEETLRQNRFNNYIKHKEDFFDLLEKLESRCSCKFSDPLDLYTKIFPNNNYLSFSFIAHNKNTTDELSNNEFIRTLRHEVTSIMATLYDPHADEDALISLIFSINEITTRLHIKQVPGTSTDSLSRLLVWPDNFAKTSSENLGTISKTLMSFAFFKFAKSKNIPKSETNKQFALNIRLPNSHITKAKNIEITNELTIGIDEYL